MTENSESLEKQLEQKDEQLADLQNQFDAVKNKSNELLNEAKQAKNKAREASEEREKIKIDKAEKDGDFEQLLKSSEKERNTLQSQLSELMNKVSSEKINNSAMKLANDLADGSNAELLSEFISKRIKFVEGELKVLDSSGNLTVSSLENLKNEFSNSEKYKSLLRGTKSSGGGASGSKASGASKETKIERSKFDSLNHVDKMAFILSGGSLVNDST